MNQADLAQLSRETDYSEPGSAGASISEIDLLRQDIERLRMALPAPPFVELPTISDWTDRLPTHPSDQYDTRSPADIQRLVIHHSAVPASVGPEQIAHYQVERRGWPGIGYHFFIGPRTAKSARPTISSPSATMPGNTARSGSGICLAGQFDNALPTEAQLAATAGLCAHLCGRLGLHAALGAVIGHGELMDTTCPGSALAGRRQLARADSCPASPTRAGDRNAAAQSGHRPLSALLAGRRNVGHGSVGRRSDLRGVVPPGLRFLARSAASHADYVTIVGDETQLLARDRDPTARRRLRRGAHRRRSVDATVADVFAGLVRRNQRFPDHRTVMIDAIMTDLTDTQTTHGGHRPKRRPAKPIK